MKACGQASETRRRDKYGDRAELWLYRKIFKLRESSFTQQSYTRN